MMKFKMMPWLVLGMLGILTATALPGRAQDTDPPYQENPLYEQYTRNVVAYVGDGTQLRAAYASTSSGSNIRIIRFTQPGVYNVPTGLTHVRANGSMTFEGPGSFYMDPTATTNGDLRTANYGVTIVGNGTTRFITKYDGTLTIKGLTLKDFGVPDGNWLTNGSFAISPKSKANTYPDAYGGTIYSRDDLVLENVTIVNTRAVANDSNPKPDGTANADAPGGSALGGAIYAESNLTMTGCTILNSYVETRAFDSNTKAMGGAVYGKKAMNIKNCTFENTHARGLLHNYGTYNGNLLEAGGKFAAGGAIASDGGSATVNNITVSYTSARAEGTEVEADGAYGGGVYGVSSNNLKSSFVQVANISRGIRPAFGTTTYKAGQQVGPFGATGTGTSASAVEFTGGSGGNHNFGSFGDVTGSVISPLQDNGGPTMTRVPLPGSPLIDGGVGSYSETGTVDQRGTNRIMLGTDPDNPNTAGGSPVVDIGAVEYDYNLDRFGKKTGGNNAPFIMRNTYAAHAVEGIGTDGDNKIVFSNANGNQLEVRDADDASSSGNPMGRAYVEAIIDSPDAIVKLGSTNGITIISQTDHHIVMRGTIDAINKALDGLTLYITDENQDYPPNFSIIINDLGNTGYGGARTYEDVSVHSYIDPLLNPLTYIDPVNNPPYIIAPGSGTVKGNQKPTDTNVLSFSSANGNPIVVGDLDINADNDTTLPYDRSQLNLKVTLSVSHGKLTVGNAQGLVDSYNGDRGVAFTAPWQLLNSVLDTLSYRPDDGYLGADRLHIVVDDLGNYGTGGPKTASKDVNILVTRDGSGGAGSGSSDSKSTIGWFVESVKLTGGKANITYVFVNGSDTDITNFVARGSIIGGSEFDTDTISISPSVGTATREYLASSLQRQLDPSKNGLKITWTTPSNDPTKSIVIRRGRRISITVSVPYAPGAIGKPLAGQWSVSFEPVNSENNAAIPAPTPAMPATNYTRP